MPWRSAAFALLYVAVVALSIPAAAAMSLAGGFLFGWMASAPVTVLAATAGAAIVFEIVKTSFGAALAERSGPFLQRLSRGFAENAFSLLLFLRLTPVFPFWAVNAVAGLSRMPLAHLPRRHADRHHSRRHRLRAGRGGPRHA